MKNKISTIFTSLFIVAVVFLLIQWQEPQKQPRKIAMKGHLDGDIRQDPPLYPGESVLYIPDARDPFLSKQPVVVTLPQEGSPVFLKGYVVGFASCVNGQFLCISNASSARQYESWNIGWVAGWKAGEVFLERKWK